MRHRPAVSRRLAPRPVPRAAAPAKPAAGAKGEDEFGYRAEFIELTRLAETAEAQAALNRPAPEQ